MSVTMPLMAGLSVSETPYLSSDWGHLDDRGPKGDRRARSNQRFAGLSPDAVQTPTRWSDAMLPSLRSGRMCVVNTTLAPGLPT
jgi:hypothetical protein